MQRLMNTGGAVLPFIWVEKNELIWSESMLGMIVENWHNELSSDEDVDILRTRTTLVFHGYESFITKNIRILGRIIISRA